MKRLVLVFALVLAIVAFTSSVYAQPAKLYEVKVNGIVADPAQSIYVERGQDAIVELYFIGADDFNVNNVEVYDGVRVEASIGGYEHGKIEAYTAEAFEVMEGVSYRKVLRFSIPADIEANKDYTLNVRIWNADGEHSGTFSLRVEPTRHLLSVYEAIISPQKVEAGKTVFVSAMIENVGDRKEDRATISISIPELGIETVRFLDELINLDENNNDDDENEQVVDLALDIPENARAGEYDLVIKLGYNRGHTESEKTYKIVVEGAEEEVATDVVVTPAQTFIANVDTVSQNVAQGQGAVYTLSLANLGQSAKVYTFVVEGVNFGTVRIDPQAVTLNKDESKSVLVYVSPAENAAVGAKVFTVKVLDGASIAKEFTLTANVVEGTNSVSGYNTFKKVLEIGFIVLLIILVILGIVVVAKKLAGNDDDDAGIEGQTYY